MQLCILQSRSFDGSFENAPRFGIYTVFVHLMNFGKIWQDLTVILFLDDISHKGCKKKGKAWPFPLFSVYPSLTNIVELAVTRNVIIWTTICHFKTGKFTYLTARAICKTASLIFCWHGQGHCNCVIILMVLTRAQNPNNGWHHKGRMYVLNRKWPSSRWQVVERNGVKI